MARWKVHVSQFVEETAVLVIEATDLAGAIAAAEARIEQGDIDWQDGDDTIPKGVERVTDMANETLWEVNA